MYKGNVEDMKELQQWQTEQEVNKRRKNKDVSVTVGQPPLFLPLPAVCTSTVIVMFPDQFQ